MLVFLTDNERKVLRSAAYAQKQTGCPVIIHPGRHYAAPAEIIRVLAEAGGNIGKTVMSHLDCVYNHFPDYESIFKMG